MSFYSSLAKHAGESQTAHFQSEHSNGSVVNLDKTLKIPVDSILFCLPHFAAVLVPRLEIR
jgi:hypothetical protein